MTPSSIQEPSCWFQEAGVLTDPAEARAALGEDPLDDEARYRRR